MLLYLEEFHPIFFLLELTRVYQVLKRTNGKQLFHSLSKIHEDSFWFKQINQGLFFSFQEYSYTAKNYYGVSKH